MNYTQHFSTKETPQSQPIPGKKMVKNNAGGYSFEISKWERLGRFLILGSEGGSYYVNEQKLTVENAENVVACLKENPQKVVDTVVDISWNGKAPKNDPAIFTMALATTPDFVPNIVDRQYAFNSLFKVVRIPTHLFQYMEMIKALRGWGQQLKKAIAKYYLDTDISKLTYHILKYKQRNGWSHRDVLRIVHPKTTEQERNAIFRYITKAEITESTPKMIVEYQKLLKNPTIEKAIYMIDNYSMSWEMFPTELLKEPKLWEHLIYNNKIPYTALMRNLARLTAIGLIKPFAEINKTIIEKITNKEYIRKSRVHPLNIATALWTYGRKNKFAYSSLQYEPVQVIIDALEEAFYNSFETVEPTGKNIVMALDVSGSMTWGNIAGSPLTPRDASAILAMVTVRTEQNYHILGFSDTLVPIEITKKDSIDSVISKIERISMGGTDCALPMIWALEKKIPNIDAFVIYTDSETWVGRTHPVQALNSYRKKYNPNAKLIVVGMLANRFSIADPNDFGMLDVVGFSTSTPKVISDFIADKI